MHVRQPMWATGYDAAKELCYFRFSDKNAAIIKPLINVVVLGGNHPINVISLRR
jgi:hypothetical protein